MFNVCKLRTLRGIKKQKDIARQIGISQNHYSQIETGKRIPSLETLIRFSRLFGVTVDEMLIKPEDVSSEVQKLASNPTQPSAAEPRAEAERTA